MVERVFASALFDGRGMAVGRHMRGMLIIWALKSLWVYGRVGNVGG